MFYLPLKERGDVLLGPPTVATHQTTTLVPGHIGVDAYLSGASMSTSVFFRAAHRPPKEPRR